jgi:hypothetical protein
MGNGYNSVAGQEAEMMHIRPRPSVGLLSPDTLKKSEKNILSNELVNCSG